LAHPQVLELGPAHVEGEALHAGDVGMREGALEELTGRIAPPRMSARPVLCRVLEYPVELAGLEALQARGLVPEVLEGHPVEVEHAAAHRQVASPVVVAPTKRDRLAE